MNSSSVPGCRSKESQGLFIQLKNAISPAGADVQAGG